MPIGYDPGGGGGRSPESIWDTIVDTVDEIVDDVIEEVYGWVRRIERVVRWVRVLVQELYYVEWEVWVTAADERTCPICQGLSGQLWAEGEGEMPPAHNNCRCRREHAFYEARTREALVWTQRAFYQPVWEWRRTGWA